MKSPRISHWAKGDFGDITTDVTPLDTVDTSVPQTIDTSAEPTAIDTSTGTADTVDTTAVSTPGFDWGALANQLAQAGGTFVAALQTPQARATMTPAQMQASLRASLPPGYSLNAAGQIVKTTASDAFKAKWGVSSSTALLIAAGALALLAIYVKKGKK